MSTKTWAQALALTLLPLTAAAQTSESLAGEQPQPANAQGPMVIERIDNGFIIEPDVKVTRFDNHTSELVGASGGWVLEKTFFIGGGGYGLVNPHNDRRLGYGGVVAQWLVNADGPVGFSVKGLFGGGASTVTSSITELIRVPTPRGAAPQFAPTTVRFRDHQGFVVAEPEVDLLFRLSSRVRITAGAGYRFTGQDRRSFDGTHLNGAVGTFGVQIGSKF